jgi:hypothetical protein
MFFHSVNQALQIMNQAQQVVISKEVCAADKAKAIGQIITGRQYIRKQKLVVIKSKNVWKVFAPVTAAELKAQYAGV